MRFNQGYAFFTGSHRYFPTKTARRPFVADFLAETVSA
jgi:hypothetical protein